MKNKDDVVNVYWAPAVYGDEDTAEWEMFYPDPTSLYDYFFINRNKDIKSLDTTFYACPAVQSNFKNTFAFKNVVKTHYKYKYNKDDKLVYFDQVSKNGIGIVQSRGMINNFGPQVGFSLSYMFFSDQSIDAHFTSPYFHKPGYTNYGTTMPGSFNIGKWFRPYNFEVQLWNSEGDFILEEDEPIFYISFKTEKKIKLHRFKYTKLLANYSNHCVGATQNMKSKASLAYRYKIFTESRFNQTVLMEIKNNIIGENYDRKI